MSDRPPQLMLAAILKVLGEPFTISERAYAKRLELMALHEVLGQVSLPQECMNDAAQLYMYASYVDSPHVFDCKRLVNKWFRQLAEMDPSIAECGRKSVRKDRPTIVVPLEAANSGHVMFRTFAASIAQLRKRFNVVGLTGGDYANFDFAGSFDKIIVLDSGEINQTIEAISEQEPEIVFYPSVGMTSWCIALSNLRLAPIQIACPGHPSSTHSPMIDYYIAESDVCGPQSAYSERLIALPPGSTRSTPKLSSIVPADRSGKFKVAIPATAMKIIPPFLRALKEIAAQVDIEYHFFPHQSGLDHAKCEYDLKQWLPDCTVYARTEYSEYMAQLNQCSLGLITFPFGAANSVLDCFQCGIPVVTLEGVEIHERMASSLMRRIDASGITYSADEFVRTACSTVRLMQKGLGPRVPTAAEIEREFSGEGVPDAYLKAFEEIYEKSCEEAACATILTE